MKRQFFQVAKATVFTIWLFAVSYTSVQAAPGSIGSLPLFVATPTQPNIFFMLDDSGSMHWTMPSDGVSSTALIERNLYDTVPDNNKEWFTWCPGANFMAYDSTTDALGNPNTNYKPWAGTNPTTNSPFPDQTDITNVWVNPITAGSGSASWEYGENNGVRGGDSGTINLSAAPVVTWTDSDKDGQYDAGECPNSYTDAEVVRADSLPADQQTNFANWFTYYRIREHATKAAVSLVVSTSSARMGMATLHHNNNVGKPIKDMTSSANKKALLTDIANINSSGGTPLRSRLDRVGQYFHKNQSTPSSLNLGSVSSPILSAANGGECQQNFVMLMTDGQWNGSSPGVGSWDNSVDNNWVHPAHKDTTSNTLADIAMKWYKTDLAPSLANKVPIQIGDNTLNLDENNNQHLVTFGVAFGPSGTVDQNPVDRTQPFTWPAPASNQDTTVDDLRHAAYNGRGQFLSASNPQTLIKALQDVISDIESRQGSAAAAAFNSTSLVAGTSLFFAGFDTINWKGDVRAFDLDVDTGDLAATHTWSAASKLNSKSNADMLNRVIYTWGTDLNGDNDGVLFNWSTSDPQPDSDILDDFKKNQDTTVETAPFTASQNRLSFVRGDTSFDGTGLFRNRVNHRLGDIIHSAPRYVGSPISGWPDSNPFGVGGSRYSDYQSTTTRGGMVYVGANDGLLHGFNSSDGEEVFAYLPSATASADIDSGLHYLTESDYQHRYYVDGSPISADVFIRTNPADPITNRSWRTVLVGSLRGGGQGLYALDVTDPSQYSNTDVAAKNTVLWEFTDQDDADLGLTYSVPEITMMNNGQWAVIIGNGYNATGTDTAKLMILFIEQGIDGQWTVGNDYIKIDTGVGSSGNKNGLSTPTLIDLDDNGTTDRIYAGDVHGNMWAFDVSDSVASNWNSAYKDTSDPTNPFPIPLFAAGNSQPITMKPLVHKPEKDWIKDSVGINAPNVMVYFGTGQYIATGDPSNTDQQAFYGIWDAGDQVLSGKLVEQTFLSGFPVDSRVLSENNVDYKEAAPSSGDLGWFINLPQSGERVFVNAFELEGLIFFNTATPSAAPCTAGGDSWLMAVDKKTGGNPGIIAFDVNGDGILDKTDVVSDGGSNDSSKAAGKKFGHGIASATAVIKTKSGKSYGYTSGTQSDKPIKSPLPSPVGSANLGKRRSWIQLFK